MTAAITTLAAGAEPAKTPEPGGQGGDRHGQSVLRGEHAAVPGPPFDKITDAISSRRSRKG
jgi:hypothetical protein